MVNVASRFRTHFCLTAKLRLVNTIFFSDLKVFMFFRCLKETSWKQMTPKHTENVRRHCRSFIHLNIFKRVPEHSRHVAARAAAADKAGSHFP